MGTYNIDKPLQDRAKTTMSSFTPNDYTFSSKGKEITNQELAKRIMNLQAMKTFSFPKKPRFNENNEDEI